jgi:hypothetical protein
MDQFQEHLQKPQNMMPLQEKSAMSPSFNLSHHHVTPMENKPLQPMDMGTPLSSVGSIAKTSLFQSAQKNRGVTPNQLQFDTPNLTPIPHQQDVSFAAPPSSFVDSNNPNTIRRAKHVAARLYYQPSPETPDASRRAASRFLRGRSAVFTDQSISISETPLRRGGRPSEVSTARKPRALFLASENKTNNTKPEDDDVDEFDESRRHEEDEQEDQEKPVATPALTTTSTMVEEEEDVMMDRHSAVQEILEVLCMLGAGYWRLCQVRNSRRLESEKMFASLTIASSFLQTVSMSRSLATLSISSSCPA